jgi:DNA gyrase subunit A
MTTKKGYVKKTALSAYETRRRTGLIAVSLTEGDELMSVKRTTGDQHIMLVTRRGMSIRFPEADVRPMGRGTRGVRGIQLEADDEVIAMTVLDPDAEGDLFVISENGYGKRSRLSEYRPQGRGGKGLKTLNMTSKTGCLIGARQVLPEDELMLVTTDGIVMRVPVEDISVQGRNTQGVIVIRPDQGDQVASVARVMNEEAEDDTEDSSQQES